MDELGLQVGKEEFEQLFKELDTNNDKMISFGDFLRYPQALLMSQVTIAVPYLLIHSLGSSMIS